MISICHLHHINLAIFKFPFISTNFAFQLLVVVLQTCNQVTHLTVDWTWNSQQSKLVMQEDSTKDDEMSIGNQTMGNMKIIGNCDMDILTTQDI